MEKNEMDRVQRGLETLAFYLDSHWFAIHNLKIAERSRISTGQAYHWMLQTLVTLGGDYLRDNKGRHRVFLAGLSSSENDEYKAG